MTGSMRRHLSGAEHLYFGVHRDLVHTPCVVIVVMGSEGNNFINPWAIGMVVAIGAVLITYKLVGSGCEQISRGSKKQVRGPQRE